MGNIAGQVESGHHLHPQGIDYAIPGFLRLTFLTVEICTPGPNPRERHWGPLRLFTKKWSPSP